MEPKGLSVEMMQGMSLAGTIQRGSLRSRGEGCHGQRGVWSGGCVHTSIGGGKGSWEVSVGANVGDEEGVGAGKNELLNLREEAKRRGRWFYEGDSFQKRDGVGNVSAVSVEIKRFRNKAESL